ncbi:MAG: D-Ala-D-Ala carboxypeptidase family metallohydrolase, partial [Clostridium sp.]
MNKYFKRKEFACKCGCGFDCVDVELLDLLTSVREFFGKPVTITSACRCPEHNAKVGGAKGSQHKFAKAADIQVKGLTPQEVQKALDEFLPSDKFGMGYGKTFTHLDVREKA